MQKKQKYTVCERLEQIAEIHTLMSLLFKSTDGTYTIFFKQLKPCGYNVKLEKSFVKVSQKISVFYFTNIWNRNKKF